MLKSIPHYPDYKISEAGDIFSFKRDKKRFKLTPTLNSHGYPSVYLYNSAGRCNKKVHRLLAQAFLPNPDNLPVIDHINRDRSDNRLSNLRWSSVIDNANNCDKLQKSMKSSKLYRVFHPNGIIEIIMNLTKYAKSLGAEPRHLSRVANGKRPHYRGIKIEAFYACL